MSTKEITSNDEISIQDLFGFFRKILFILKKKIRMIFLFGIIGFLLGLAFIKQRPTEYTSSISFVVEESSSGAGGISSLAGQLGMDIGGSGGGIFSGGNVIFFLQSQNLCREVLLTPIKGILPRTTLADRYSQVYGLNQKWAKRLSVGSLPFMTKEGQELTRLQDSLMQLVIKRILNNDLSVTKPDKKGSFVKVEMSSRDEIFSKMFCEILVQKAIDQYLESKNKYRIINVEQLQKRVDSLNSIMTSKTFSAAKSKQALVDLNPAIMNAPVTNDILTRDMAITYGLYASTYNNLQSSKSMLSQETPVVEIIENSRFPLRQNEEDNLKILIFSSLAGFLISALYLVLKNWRMFN